MTVEQLEVSLFLGRHVADVATEEQENTCRFTEKRPFQTVEIVESMVGCNSPGGFGIVALLRHFQQDSNLKMQPCTAVAA